MGGAEHFFCRLLRALKNRGQELGAVTRPSSPLHTYLDNEVQCFTADMRNGWDILSVISLKRIISRTRPRIVQTYMGRATRLTRVPKGSSTIHVARLGGYYKIKGYYEHADAWVGNTKGLCDYLVRNGLPPNRVYHIGNFVEPATLASPSKLDSLRLDLGFPEDAIILFALGRLIPKKGFEDLLHALSMIPRDFAGRPIRVLIAGDGPLRTQLIKMSEDLGLSEIVTWLGWKEDPGPYFSLAHIFVCPSRHEPMGNVILEAWAHGLPVISTMAEGPVELIEQGSNGLLVPLTDPEGLAAGLREVLDQGEVLWRRLGQKGLETLKTRHNEEVVSGAYIEMYEELEKRGP